MSGKRVISLAELAWTVRARRSEAIDPAQPPEWEVAPAWIKHEPKKLRDALTRGVPARVPGCVHQALIAAELIESPDHGDAEERLQWIGRTEWEYRCEFEWTDAGAAKKGAATRIELVLDGLDTVAEVSLNGQIVGLAESFFFPHRFDIGRALRAGQNRLSIRFTPPLQHIRAEEAQLRARPFNGDQAESGWEPFVFIRKPACNFGWDWGPKVATVGIAGGAWIESWDTARIEHTRPLVMSATVEHAEIVVHTRVELAGAEQLAPGGNAGATETPPRHDRIDTLDPRDADNPVLRGEGASGASGEEPHIVVSLYPPGGGPVVARGRASLAPRRGGTDQECSVRLGIAAPELWWPRGYGTQSEEEERPLYGLHVELRDGDRVLDTWKGRVGLRTVELDTARDKWGSAFTLRVNGQPVFCMGANWIPEGLFAGYAAETTIRARVRDAAAMNANMLRVWGGGLYEPECYYDECDRRGILVWQDFMFSCGMYPEEAPFGGDDGLIACEARHQIARLSSHASVALWCGGNETIWGHDEWGWKERLKPDQSWGQGFWLDLLPRLCTELDPSRPYWANSPWSGVDDHGTQRDVLDADHGDRHTWEVDAWTDGFRAPTPTGIARFCSEFGQQSPSCLETLREQLGGPDASAFARELGRRQRGPGGDKRWYEAPVAAVLGGESALRLIAAASESEIGFKAWLDCVHELQARAVARGIEWHRVNRPRCGGVLFWQLNDCWAGHSWSAIDAAGRKKPLWEAARRAMSPRLLSIHEVEGSPKLYAVNDTDDAWEGEIVTQLCSHRPERTLAERRLYVRLGPRVAGVVEDLGKTLQVPTAAALGLMKLIASSGEESGFDAAVHLVV